MLTGKLIPIQTSENLISSSVAGTLPVLAQFPHFSKFVLSSAVFFFSLKYNSLNSTKFLSLYVTQPVLQIHSLIHFLILKIIFKSPVL